jgi:hypothetical protein
VNQTLKWGSLKERNQGRSNLQGAPVSHFFSLSFFFFLLFRILFLPDANAVQSSLVSTSLHNHAELLSCRRRHELLIIKQKSTRLSKNAASTL